MPLARSRRQASCQRALDPSWPVFPERRRVGLTTVEINALPYEATACPSCGAEVSKPPKGRKKCTSCGVYMFVVVLDHSRRRLVTEAELNEVRKTEWTREEKEETAADREWRTNARAAGLQVARNEDESVSLDVVGESHYQRDLASLKMAMATSPGWSVDAVAWLVREPNNRYDRNAVQVLIHRRLVGYLSREDAEGAQLVAQASRSHRETRVRGGDHRRRPRRRWFPESNRRDSRGATRNPRSVDAYQSRVMWSACPGRLGALVFGGELWGDDG